MANNTGVFRQKITAKLPANNSKLISAGLLQEVLVSSADAIDEIFETFSLTDSLGNYNATTNVATLKEAGTTFTPTSTANQDNGKYFDVVVTGTQSITGTSTVMAVGGRLISRGTKWDYIPPNDQALQKIITAEPKITVLENQNSKLVPTIVATPRIQQVPSYAYTTYQIAGQKEQKFWFFPKGVKKLDKVGIFVFKRSSVGTISSDVRVQVVHQRSAVHTILLDITVPFAEFAANDDADSIVDYHNYEYKINLTNSVTTANGDKIFVDITCDSALNPVYSDTNKADLTGEWNNGSGLYYRAWLTSLPGTTYTTVPALPAADSNPGIIHFYENVLTLTRIETIESNIVANTSSLAGKAVGNNLVFVGTNKFDKATMLQDGEGIGSDGVIFSVANFGRIKDMPVLPNTAYFLSGHNLGTPRGLKFLNAAGATISFIGSPTNNYAFTTPALCTKITVQIYSSVGSIANKDTVQIQLGTAATAYESYVTETVNDKINSLNILAKYLLAGAKIGEKNVADTGLTDALAIRATALENVASLGLTDFLYLFPSNIYLPDGNAFARKEPTLLYLQHFIREKIDIWLNGGKNFVITAKNATNAGTVIQDTLAITLGGGKYLTKNININRLSANISLLAAQFPKVGCLGDSILTPRPRNGVYTGIGASTIYGMSKEIAEKNRIDAGGSGFSYLCMGRSNFGDGTLTYNGNALTIKQFADGQGGFATSTFLRHPCRMWVFPLGGWDLLGLSTTLGRGYNGSSSDNTLISKAIYGVVAPVISANSYNTLISEVQISNSLGAWTGSAPQIALVQAWIDGVAAGSLSTVQNRYFDYSKSGTNRFNFAKYKAEWKTLADDGVTPLVLGSTAGTKVVSLANHQVCTPTHYLITTGENDRLHVTNPVDIANDIIELATEITTQLTSCKVGVLLTDIPGPMFPERHPNYIGLFSQSDHNNKWDLYKELQTRFGSLASQVTNKIFLIPTWFAMQPNSHSFTIEQNDEGAINNTLQIANDDYNHPGYFALRSAGAQVYGWVAATYGL